MENNMDANSNNGKIPWARFKAVAQGDGLWVTLIYRWVAARLSFVFYKCGIGPNMVTMLSSLVSMLAMIFLIIGYPMTMIGALGVGGLLALGYALDCADGQLARATGLSSKLGEWLDHTMDLVTKFIVHFSVAWILFQRADALSYSFGLAFLAFVLNLGGTGVFFFAWQMKNKIAGDNKNASMTSAKRDRKLALMKVPLQVTDYGIFVCLFFLTTSSFYFEWAYLIYGIITFFIFTVYMLYSGYSLSRLKN